MALFQAEGRDIYGHGLTVRNVYEIDADVRPGNSGGPLVLPDGRGGRGRVLAVDGGPLDRVRPDLARRAAPGGGGRAGACAGRHRRLRPGVTRAGPGRCIAPTTARPVGLDRVHGAPHRGLRDHRRPAHGRPGGPGRLDRLAVPAAVRLGGVLRQAARDRGPRVVAASPRSGADRATHRHYRGDTLVLESEFVTDEGTVRIIDCMPIREQHPEVVRLVEGVRGTVTMEMQLTIRFGYGQVVPWVRRTDGTLERRGRTRRTVAVDHGADPRVATCRRWPSSRSAEGQTVPFSLSWYPANETPPRPVDARYAIADTEQWWEEWVSQCTYDGEYRDAVVRSLITLKALTYEPDRRDRGRAHHLAARDARRRAQLGLPVLLAARRHADPRVADAGRLLPGGHGLADLAAAGHGRRPVADADHVRGRRRAPPRRVGGRLAARATRARRRCGSAMRPPASSSSTSTARSCPPCTSRSSPDDPDSGPAWELQLALHGRSWRPGGASRTTASGRCAAPAATSPTPRSWPGWPSTGPSGRSRSTAWTARSSGGGQIRQEIHDQVCELGFNADDGLASPSTTAPTSSTPAC